VPSVECPSCKTPLDVDGGASTFECSSCKKMVTANQCECGRSSVTTTAGAAWSCPKCKEWHEGQGMNEGAVLRWCPEKSIPVQVAPDARWFGCPHCQQTHTVPDWGGFKCETTGKAVFCERGIKKVQCPHCQKKHQSPWWFSEELRNVTYMGGHPKIVLKKDNTSLAVDPGGIHLKGIVHEIVNMPWPSIKDAAVDGASTIKSRLTVTRMATLGVFSLAAPKRTQTIESYLTLTLADGSTPVFHIEGTPESRTRAVIATAQQRIAGWPKPSLLVKMFSATPSTFEKVIADAVASAPKAQQRPVVRTQAPAVQSSSMTDELAKLVQFHASGALSDEEFTAAKARLLGS
jgi:LSD1 subclass zinc finger protein